MDTNTEHPLDIDLDLDISVETYTGPLYELHQLSVQYTYNDPETIYTVGDRAAVAVIRRLKEPDLINLSVQMDIIRYAIQQEIGRRNLGAEADKVASRYFNVGKLQGTYERENQIKRVAVDPELFSDLDDLEL
jgi:hypothetical protein